MGMTAGIHGGLFPQLFIATAANIQTPPPTKDNNIMLPFVSLDHFETTTVDQIQPGKLFYLISENSVLSGLYLRTNGFDGSRSCGYLCLDNGADLLRLRIAQHANNLTALAIQAHELGFKSAGPRATLEGDSQVGALIVNRDGFQLGVRDLEARNSTYLSVSAWQPYEHDGSGTAHFSNWTLVDRKADGSEVVLVSWPPAI
ncbi:hypothetical protein [Rhodanobacter ginsengiterrae]|uniref:hypothetical protein n=1 Tax=Rhodanobacter ginsengiterrae TaxID=2008451 RepID=UPI003CF4704E